MTSYDSPWKETLEVYFAQFLELLFPEIHRDIDWSRGYEFLDKELEKIDPKDELGKGVVDKLVKVWLKSGEESWLLLHIEVQSQEETGFAFRMHVYHSMISLRYNREVVSLAVLGDDRPNWRPDTYLQVRWGFRREFRFPIVKLLDWLDREATLLASRNPVAHVILAHLRAQETSRQPEERRSYKFQLVRNLYERGFGVRDVRQLFRVIDWMMTLPADLENEFRQDVEIIEKENQMPFMTCFERHGREEGLKEGILESIAICLKVKFGKTARSLTSQVRKIDDVGHLRRILRSVEQVNSVDEMKKVIQNPA